MIDAINRVIANTVVMVKPQHFSFNDETAVNNAFQTKLTNLDISALAMDEFSSMVKKMRAVGINVIELDSPKCHTPDAVFPNNWFSTHVISGKHYLYIYPMFSKNRQAEVQIACLKNALEQRMNVPYQVVDFRENAGNRALEGTGVFIFDHQQKYAFLSLSQRADIELARKVTDQLGYRLISFHSVDRTGAPIYHTNVMMSIGEKLAFVCLESIANKDERDNVESALEVMGKEIITLSYEQIYQMAANVLELVNDKEKHFLLLSESANQAFSKAQTQIIDRYVTRLPCDIPTIETVGGGSVRCMLAEVF